MRNVLLTAAAVGAIATAAMTIPASAQVYLDAGPGGVEIGDGYRHRHDWDSRRHDRDWRGAYAYGGDCRVIRDRTVTPSGRVITSTRRICD